MAQGLSSAGRKRGRTPQETEGARRKNVPDFIVGEKATGAGRRTWHATRVHVLFFSWSTSATIMMCRNQARLGLFLFHLFVKEKKTIHSENCRAFIVLS